MSAPVSFSLDGRSVRAAAGTTVWEAAAAHGVDIPVLCHDPRLRPAGVCRLCVVEVKGSRLLASSCTRAVEEGLEVETRSPRVESARRTLLELLLADHPSPCAAASSEKGCALESLGERYGARPERFPPTSRRPPRGAPRHRPRDSTSPVIEVDLAACILCDRCVRGCDEIQSNDVIGRLGKGAHAWIGFDHGVPMGESTCVACGECQAVCPTGALISRGAAPRSAHDHVDTVCPYCGVGCAITAHVERGRIVEITGRDSPVNRGRLCVKGRYGHDYAAHPQRLTVPLIRRESAYPKGPLSSEVAGRGRGGRPGGVVRYEEVLPAFREASWDEALDLAAGRLKAIRDRHGSAALAGFGSAKCSNEEAYLFQKLVRAVFGTHNVDHCTRLCHASSVAALMETLGSGAVSNVFADALRAEALFIIGSNTGENHPVAATFFKEARSRGAKLLVADPRRPDIAAYANLYLPFRAGTDVALLNGMMSVVVEEGMVRREFVRERTEGYEALEAKVREWPPERAAAICGVSAETIRAAACLYGRAERAMIFWGMGISQHTTGTDNARCLISLCLLTGNVGRPGTGLHPLRGQNNVQGASDAGLIPMVLPGYQPVGDEAARGRFERAWGVKLGSKPGLTVTEILAAALEGRIRGMYMLGENPFLSDPNVNKVRRALAALEFLAVQDIFLTETAEFADVILPATSFFEKEGTYTNTDRRVQIGRRALEPPGQARSDWEVICDIGTRMGYPMRYRSPQEVFDEFRALTPDYAGLTYERLGTEGILWPCPSEEHPGTSILFERSFPRGRGKFVPVDYRPPQEEPDGEYPFVLNTGRLLEHWHTGTMTRRASALAAIAPGPYVEIHPDDARRLGVADGAWVRVRSRRGEIELPARVARRTPAGSVFIPFHFREAPANVLTIEALDPHGKIPEFKFCAVAVEPIPAPA
jgi:formate dehydrogenase major subunit